MKTTRFVFVLVLFVLATGAAFAGGGREPGDLIGPEEALQMVERGDAILVDVRDTASYVEAHIAGAILVPLFEIAAAADQLAAREQTVITYCSCPAEETSIAAAVELIGRGVEDVLVLRGGIRGWAVAGYPLKNGARP